LSGPADGAIGAGNGQRRLVENDGDLALGVPFAEIPQRFGHLAQPIAAVDDRGDLSRLAELHEGRQVLGTLPDGQEPYLLALASSNIFGFWRSDVIKGALAKKVPGPGFVLAARGHASPSTPPKDAGPGLAGLATALVQWALTAAVAISVPGRLTVHNRPTIPGRYRRAELPVRDPVETAMLTVESPSISAALHARTVTAPDYRAF
jgi:hypothetical protein